MRNFAANLTLRAPPVRFRTSPPSSTRHVPHISSTPRTEDDVVRHLAAALALIKDPLGRSALCVNSLCGLSRITHSPELPIPPPRHLASQEPAAPAPSPPTQPTPQESPPTSDPEIDDPEEQTRAREPCSSVDTQSSSANPKKSINGVKEN